MRPILFQLGPFPLSSFGLFLLLAFVVGITMARRRAAPLGIDPSQMLDLALYMIIGGIVAGRLGYVIANLSMFAQEPLRIITIWQDSGLVFYGALLGGGAVAFLYTRRHQIPLLRFLDVCAPPLAVGYAVAMIGALLHGLYLGRPTTLPWAVQMVFEQRHPAPVYLLLASVGTYVVLRFEEHRTTGAGTLFFLWLVLHAVARFAVEFFVESPPIVGPLTLAQAIAVLAGAGAVAGLIVAGRPQEAAPAQQGPD
jgi:phosphatidylglycerol:prolipoprotein diacylglycerol transferase